MYPLHSYLIHSWVPWVLLVIALVVLVLLVLAIGTRQPRRKMLLGLSAPVVLLTSCVGLAVANSYHAPLVNVPAPAPAALSLAFLETPGNAPATVDVLNARTGAVRWRQSVGDQQAQLTADAHTLYLTTSTTVLALRASDDKTLWNTSLGAEHLYASDRVAPVLADGMVYVSVYISSGTGGITALRATDGTLAWRQMLHTPPAPLPVGFEIVPLTAGGGMVYAGTPTGTILAFHSSDGTPAWNWTATTDEEQAVSPVFAGGVVYVACYLHIVALHASDGTLLWSHPLATPLSNYHLSLGASGLYFVHTDMSPGSYPEYLYSVNAQTGQVQWKHSVFNAWAKSQAFETGQFVYFASGAYLDALRVRDGQRVWRHSSNQNVGFGDPFMMNNIVFVKSFIVYPHMQTSCPDECEPDEAVNALNATTGSLYWRWAWPEIDEGGAILGVTTR